MADLGAIQPRFRPDRGDLKAGRGLAERRLQAGTMSSNNWTREPVVGPDGSRNSDESPKNFARSEKQEETGRFRGILTWHRPVPLARQQLARSTLADSVPPRAGDFLDDFGGS